MLFSDEGLINPVKASLDKSISMLERDGGSLEFLGIKNSVVYVYLIGARKGCASSGTTLKYGLEGQLKIDIHPEITVVNLNGGAEDFTKL